MIRNCSVVRATTPSLTVGVALKILVGKQMAYVTFGEPDVDVRRGSGDPAPLRGAPVLMLRSVLRGVVRTIMGR
jgi:hypothetical protein